MENQDQLDPEPKHIKSIGPKRSKNPVATLDPTDPSPGDLKVRNKWFRSVGSLEPLDFSPLRNNEKSHQRVLLNRELLVNVENVVYLLI